MEIIQTYNGGFELKNGPRSFDITFEQASWILEDFYDLDFDIEKAKEFYNLK